MRVLNVDDLGFDIPAAAVHDVSDQQGVAGLPGQRPPL